jgi:methylated-DNA-[protein]-cysteine S-methyltransferase
MDAGFTLFDTPIGPCGLAWDAAGIVGTLLPEASAEATRARLQRRHRTAREMPPPPAMQHATERIRGLLEGGADDLKDLELDLTGVQAFHQRVYALTRAIAPGRTRTYGELALELGAPHAARAVGQALGSNPFPIIVPCHRVLAAGGFSGGFSAPGGTRTKLMLLQIERAPLGGTPGLFDA